MSAKFGILSVGAYIPRRRLQRSAVHAANSWFAPNLRGLSKGEKAIVNWDEDSVTMAVDAARDCLTGLDKARIDAVSLASTTLPFADRLNAGIVKEALNLNEAIQAFDLTGGQRAGTSALVQALGSNGAQLCLAADNRKARAGSEGEMLQGDAGAAVLVGEGDPIATLRGSHSITVDFVDHFRATGEDYDYAWEKRWVRDEGFQKVMGGAVAQAIEKIGVKASDIDHVLIALPGRSLPPKFVKSLGFNPDNVADILFNDVGYTGAAHPFLMLAAALERAKPNETILLASFGQGADVMLFETTKAVTQTRAGMGFEGGLANKSADENYLRYLFHRGQLDLEKGMRAEYDEKQPGTALSRDRKTVLGLIGGKCRETGVVQFPKTDISVAQNQRATGTQDDYPLSDKLATVTTFTADRLTYSPDPPTYYGMIDFEGGGRMISEFSDVTDEDMSVGAEMRMVFRIKARDDMRKFTKYFWKATPVHRDTKSEAK